MLKRFKSKFIIIIAVCLVAGFGYVRKAAVTVSPSPVLVKTVIIDPGHPGLANTMDLVRNLP